MPAKTDKQRRFMKAVERYKDGEGKGSREVREAARTMSKREVRDMTRKGRKSKR